MYLRLAKRIECIRPSPVTLTSSAIGAAAGRQFRPRASSLAEYRVRHNRGLPRPPGFSTLMLTLLSATSGQAFRVSCSSSACRGKDGARFNSKPSNVRKFVTGPDHRICRSHTHSRFSELDRALDNCRGILDHLRQVDLPVALIRMLDQSAFFNGATWLSMDFMERCMKQPTGSPPLHLA